MKNYEICLLIYIIVVFVTYWLFVYFKYGILTSISDSYYRENNKALFTLFIWSIAFPMIILGVSVTPLMFFAGAFLAFVGAAPAFKEEQEGTVHIIGATGGISLGYIAMIVAYHQYYLPAIMGLFAILAVPKKLPKFLDKSWMKWWTNGIPNYTWWIETMAFVLVIINLIIK
jgi:hypothetical protein